VADLEAQVGRWSVIAQDHQDARVDLQRQLDRERERSLTLRQVIHALPGGRLALDRLDKGEPV
jgi:hypothetical protein